MASRAASAGRCEVTDGRGDSGRREQFDDKVFAEFGEAMLGELADYVGQCASMKQSPAAARMRCMGPLDVLMEPRWPAADTNFLRSVDYRPQLGDGTFGSAVSFDRKTGECRAAAR